MKRCRLENSQLIFIGFGVAIVVIILIAGVAIAILNGQLNQVKRTKDSEIEQLKISNQQGELLAQMSAVLSSTLDYREVLQKMLDLSLPAFSANGGKATVGMALLFESERELSVAAARNGASGDKKKLIDIGKAPLIQEVVDEAEAVVSPNLKRDKGLAAIRSFRNSRSAVCAPLRVGYDTYGVVIFGTDAPQFYQEQHRKLVSALCGQVVIPLENAQLIEDLRREQQKILAKEEEARRKLARDLHDGPTQSVSAIAMRLNFVKMLLENNETDKGYEEAAKLEELAQKTVREIRTMLFAMRPVVLETKGLIAALNGYAERINANESFRLVTKNNGYDGQLDTEKEGVLFAIVEEAVGNAKKHARASEIQVNVSVDKKNILLVEVKDNGVGFDVEKTRATYDQRSSLGMINLFERAEAIGGQCNIDSAVGKGTSVQITVPLS